MPVCPGCERNVSYDRLDVHERYCEGIWNDGGGRTAERLERRLLALENRIDSQLSDFETDVERRLARLEKTRKGRSLRRR